MLLLMCCVEVLIAGQGETASDGMNTRQAQTARCPGLEARAQLPGVEERRVLRQAADRRTIRDNTCPDLNDCFERGELAVIESLPLNGQPGRFRRRYECRTYDLTAEERLAVRDLEAAARDRTVFIGLELSGCLPRGLVQIQQTLSAQFASAPDLEKRLRFLEMTYDGVDHWRLTSIGTDGTAKGLGEPLAGAIKLPESICAPIQSLPGGLDFVPKTDIFLVHCGRVEDALPWGFYPEDPCARSTAIVPISVDAGPDLLTMAAIKEWLPKFQWPAQSLRDLKQSKAKVCAFHAELPINAICK